jgi:hypothetical protein
VNYPTAAATTHRRERREPRLQALPEASPGAFSFQRIFFRNRLHGDQNGCQWISAAGAGETHRRREPDSSHCMFCRPTGKSTVCKSRSPHEPDAQSINSKCCGSAGGEAHFTGASQWPVQFSGVPRCQRKPAGHSPASRRRASGRGLIVKQKAQCICNQRPPSQRCASLEARETLRNRLCSPRHWAFLLSRPGRCLSAVPKPLPLGSRVLRIFHRPGLQLLLKLAEASLLFSERPCNCQPYRKRLHRMQHVIHHAVLTHCCRYGLHRKAHRKKTVGLEQRAIGVFGLRGL